MHKTKSGFTIVELLIVIVVIAILAAITIVAYNGIQNRAKATTASADIANVSKKAAIIKALNGSYVTTVDLISGDNAIKVSQGTYRVFTVCANSNGDYAVVAELQNGDVYYSKNGGPSVNSNSLDSLNPCPTLGISSPNNIYGGMPTSTCAVQGGSCTFTGSQTVAYGAPDRGQFYAKKNQTSPVDCSNGPFGDPAFGYQKWCYILQY